MRQIGTIKLVQVQRSSLKVGKKPECHYDPVPLQVVDALLLSRDGVTGVTAEGEKILDIHNSTHPETKNVGGVNGISLGFTSHYQSMRAKFGPHMVDGIAGENVLIEADGQMELATLGSRVVFQDQESEELLYLDEVRVAAPCVEFSHWALQKELPVPAELLKNTLIFLNDGRRGFYATFLGEKSFPLRAGMRVFVEM